MALPALVAAFAPLLVSLVKPLISKVFAALGIGLVTYTGYNALINLVKGYFDSAFSGLPADVSQLIFLSGMPQGIGIILSAIAARVTLTSLTKLQFLSR